MSEPETGGRFSLEGLIVDSIPKKIHKLINIWIVLASMFRVFTRWYRKYQEHMQYTVTLRGNDNLYDAAQAWLVNEMPSKKKKGIQVSSKGNRNVFEDSPDDGNPPESSRGLKLRYDGSVEQTVIIEGHKVKVRNQNAESRYTGGHADEYNSWVSANTKLLFIAQNVNGRDAVLRLLNQLEQERSQVKHQACVYTSTQWGSMLMNSGLRPRPLSTVILPENTLEDLLVDLEHFLKTEKDYQLLGLPWHRGYLFHGAPGGGKTSLATALATVFDRDVYCINLGSLDDDAALTRAMNDISVNSILLLEDIDIIHAATERTDKIKGITMQGLLNVLDGLSTPHGMITIMTTNHYESLESAVIRAGRIDVEVEIGELQGDDLSRLMSMLSGDGYFKVPSHMKAMPSDIVGIAKNHIGNQEAMRFAFEDWMNHYED